MGEIHIDLDGLLDTFFEEAEEHLNTFETGLLELEATPEDHEVIGRIFRAAHSIKGASGTFGLGDITSFTHALETVLDRLRAREIAYSADVARALLASVDVLRGLVRAAREGAAPPPEAVPVRALLEQFYRTAAPKGEAIAQPIISLQVGRKVRVRFAPKPDFMCRGMDPLAILRDVADCGEVESRTVDASAVPSLDDLDPESFYLSFVLVMRTERTDAEIAEAFAFVDDLCTFAIEAELDEAPQEQIEPDAPVEGGAAGEARSAPTTFPKDGVSPPKDAKIPAAASTIRVATEKVDKLLDLVSEIVIAQAMIVDATRAPGPDAETRLNDALQALDRHTRELQERVMSIRMVPLASVFGRLPRMVRDLAGTIGKKVQLVVEGEGTEIDKSMVEQLADPLTHLVRNAIDHGLEFPEQRAEQGKPAEGTVRIRAFHQGGNVVIEVGDDGKGLDSKQIRAKAERLGLVSPDEVLTDEQIHEFIFHAGFSTAAKVSDVSGRGVGMDVVKRNVEALKGSLTLSTEMGHGTQVRLRLPLTLAIVDGLAVRVGAQTFVVPLLSVLESFRPTPSQVRAVLGASEVIDIRGTSVPVIRLHELLDEPNAERDPSRALLCIVEANGTSLALLVDDVIGQAQFVVKSLEVNYRKVPSLMGATILGDGRVAMIIDVQSLARTDHRSRTVATDSEVLLPVSEVA
jgi:two-component system, chemotaxis family, sensor kinase CheA